MFGPPKDLQKGGVCGSNHLPTVFGRLGYSHGKSSTFLKDEINEMEFTKRLIMVRSSYDIFQQCIQNAGWSCSNGSPSGEKNLLDCWVLLSLDIQNPPVIPGK